MSAKKLAPNIMSDPDIMNGKPVIEGTRIPVYIILGKIAAGLTIQDFQEEYDLTADQVRDAIQFAASLLEHEDIKLVS